MLSRCQEELGKKEQEQALLEVRRRQAAITKENDRLDNLIFARKTLTIIGWNAVLGILSYPANAWVGGICGGVAGVVFTSRSMVKDSIKEITERQRKRKAAGKKKS